jgi:hypothetical protein
LKAEKLNLRLHNRLNAIEEYQVMVKYRTQVLRTVERIWRDDLRYGAKTAKAPE